MSAKSHHTAIIYDRKGHVLSIGQNSYIKTHPLMALHGAKVGLPDKTFLHAEVAAIIRCKDLTKAHKIFVSRFNKKGEPMNSKPCPVCASALRAAGIEVIDYTISVPN